MGCWEGPELSTNLRQVFAALNMHPVNRPEVMVPLAEGKFDEEGMLTDEKTRAKIRELLESLVSWARKIKG